MYDHVEVVSEFVLAASAIYAKYGADVRGKYEREMCDQPCCNPFAKVIDAFAAEMRALCARYTWRWYTISIEESPRFYICDYPNIVVMAQHIEGRA